MTIEELRGHFPHTQRGIYLNHAATGPLSRPVVAAVQTYLRERHQTNIDNYLDVEPILASARERIAALIGTRPERVELAPNTSYGLNVLARGLDWQKGDRIAVPSCEFPANVYPFLNLERYGVEVDFISHDDGCVSVEAVERALRPRTRLLALSWVQYLSGYRSDLREIGRLCKDRDVLFCVDAIQGAGALRLDVESSGIDFLACGGHKWIMATQGIGFLYVTEALQDQIAPAAGWLHGPIDWDHLDDYELSFHSDASRFRLGTMNQAGIVAIDAALALREDAGPEWCERRVLDRAGELAHGCGELGLKRYGSSSAQHASGIVTIEHPHVDALRTHLAAHGIETAVRQKKLRFSATYYNSSDEIERTLSALEAFLTR